jgi:hypothetical protein
VTANIVEQQGQFSPDGRWVSYTSDESGRSEVYVKSFNGAPAKFQISTDGGEQSRWRGDGKEIYYLSADAKIMAVRVKSAAESLERESPRPLFDARWLTWSNAGYAYDVSRDGQRFLVIQRAEGATTEPLSMITNWSAGLPK